MKLVLSDRWQVAVALLLLAAGLTPLSAQTECTYEDCALRVRQRLFSPGEVVRGAEEDRVGRFSFFGFAPDLPMLAEGGDSVAVNYHAFRSGNNSGAWMEIAGVTGLLAALVVATAEGSSEVATGVGLAASVPLIWGAIRRVQARDRLGRAIWWYNRSLRTSP